MRDGCKIEAVEFFVSGASHAQPAILKTRDSSRSRAEGDGMVTHGGRTGDQVLGVHRGGKE
jgi:hypothetical protein